MSWRGAAATIVVASAVAACSGGSTAGPPAPSAPPVTGPATATGSAPGTATGTATPTPTAPPGTVPPDWLGSRPLRLRPDGLGHAQQTPPELRHRRFTLADRLAPLPGDGFAARVGPVPDDVLARSTWKPGCPVAADDLSWIRLTFWGFDDRRHTGELLVNRAVARDVVSVFRDLYAARFPFEELRVTSPAELDAAPTGDGNTTGAFVCRPATGASTYSQHAYGLAIDLDPFQNPYVKGEGPGRLVLPELATSYADRADVRAGMITPDGVVVRAFERIGWTWGGDWSSLKDYQHFSSTGR